MTLQHSAKPPEDLASRKAIRFYFRGDTDLVECLVSWDALDRLEARHSPARSDRLARFEQHRVRIEEAAMKKLKHGESRPVQLEAQDLMN